jgi:hypothetical protein
MLNYTPCSEENLATCPCFRSAGSQKAHIGVARVWTQTNSTSAWTVSIISTFEYGRTEIDD